MRDYCDTKKVRKKFGASASISQTFLRRERERFKGILLVPVLIT